MSELERLAATLASLGEAVEAVRTALVEALETCSDALELASEVGAASTLEALSEVTEEVAGLADRTAALDAGLAGAAARLTALAAPAPAAPGGEAPVRPAGSHGSRPSGVPAHAGERDSESTVRARTAENETAVLLAEHGFQVQQNPALADIARARARMGDRGRDGSHPDYLVEGRVFDCYSPSPNKGVRGIWSEVRKKVDKGQTQRVVVDLRNWHGDVESLTRQLGDWPIAGLRELVVVMPDRRIRHWDPGTRGWRDGP